MLPELAEGPESFAVPEGTLKIWRPRKGLVFTQVTGRMIATHAECIIAAVDHACLECPKEAVGIHDWLDIESYEISVYARMSTWSPRVAKKMRRVTIGVRSPLVAMAVRTVNLAVGGRFEVFGQTEQLLEAARAEWQRQR